MHVLIQNPINHTAHENKTQHLQNIYSGTYIYYEYEKKHYYKNVH